MIEAERVHTANHEFPYSVWRLRVPGGWLYQVAGMCPVFVPEEAEQPAIEPLHPSVSFTPLSGKHGG
jgi:hypothetical protein